MMNWWLLALNRRWHLTKTVGIILGTDLKTNAFSSHSGRQTVNNQCSFSHRTNTSINEANQERLKQKMAIVICLCTRRKTDTIWLFQLELLKIKSESRKSYWTCNGYSWKLQSEYLTKSNWQQPSTININSRWSSQFHLQIARNSKQPAF